MLLNSFKQSYGVDIMPHYATISSGADTHTYMHTDIMDKSNLKKPILAACGHYAWFNITGSDGVYN